MQVNTSNDVKIYNLSAGKSLPDWISARKRRQAEKADVSLRRRIEVLQDFDMPEVSSSIKITPNGQYIMAAGAYKPRVRCFDTQEMSMKFERCMDSEIVKFLILSEDYTKMIFLHADRFVEFHAQYGKYHRVRMPKFGRDLVYQPENCHLYVVGASQDIFRLNLEEGRFMPSLSSSLDTEINTCDINPVHQLLVTGTTSGHIECWDPRSGKSESTVNCRIADVESDSSFSVTKVKFRDSLNLAVGTNTGHILLYDIRSQRPYLVKDHNYGLPIKAIEFIAEHDYIASIDTKIMKIWERETGKAVTSVEPGSDLNDLCVVPGTGLIFMANEAPKILTHLIPILGPAPRWCGFLDSLTEELEETSESAIYDDYKFLTADELEILGLGDLIGTNLLRAYMHGFFVDVRLYKKAKSMVEPFNYADYRKQKIQEKITSEQSENRVKKDKLPKVNAALAKKLMDSTPLTEKEKKKSKLVGDSNALQDTRFGELFKNPDFEIDPTSEEYRLLNPLVSRMDRRRQQKAAEAAENDEGDDDMEDAATAVDELQKMDGEGTFRESSDSSDDDREWVKERRKQHRMLRDEKRRERNRVFEESLGKTSSVKEVEQSSGSPPKVKRAEKSLGRRIAEDGERRRDGGEEVDLGGGNRQIVWRTNEGNKARSREEMMNHSAERRKLHRSARPIESRLKKPWNGKGKR